MAAREALILYIDPKVKEKLRVIADEEDRSISAVARRIVEGAIESLPRPSDRPGDSSQ